jgi:hypothetical protein
MFLAFIELQHLLSGTEPGSLSYAYRSNAIKTNGRAP